MKKKTTTTKNKVKKLKNTGVTYFGFALDSSGSMHSIKDSIMEAYNSQLTTIKDNKDLECRISLVVFGEGNTEVNAKYINEPLSTAKNLTDKNYLPSGGTPMRDGVGMLVSELSKIKLNKKDAVMIYIFSDGMENASKEWSVSSLKEKIEELEKTGQWTFSYIGANQNSMLESSKYGMDTSNSLSFDATANGVRGMGMCVNSGTSSYLDSRRKGLTKVSDMYNSKK